MELYHFTAQRFLSGIKRVGLVHGALVVRETPPTIVRGWQWLTRNPSFEQEWAIGSGVLPYKRNEVRLTFHVPAVRESELSEAYDILSMLGDPENWMLWHGIMPAAWITNIDHKTEALSA
jgi:hypothetical protein